MTIAVFVEGAIDERFLKKYIISKQYPFELEIKNTNGKQNVLPTVRGMISGTAGIIVGMEDLDSDSIKQMEEKYFQSLMSKYPTTSKLTDSAFDVDDNKVLIIPLGMPEELLLKKFGVNQHMIEDYLLKILLQDNNVVNSLSSGKVKSAIDLSNLLNDILKVLNERGITFQSSKSIVDIIKGIFCFSGSPATFAEKILELANEELLKNVMQKIDEAFKLIHQWSEKQ